MIFLGFIGIYYKMEYLIFCFYFFLTSFCSYHCRNFIIDRCWIDLGTIVGLLLIVFDGLLKKCTALVGSDFSLPKTWFTLAVIIAKMWSDLYLNIGHLKTCAAKRLGKGQGGGLFNVFFQSDISIAKKQFVALAKIRPCLTTNSCKIMLTEITNTSLLI